MIENASSAVNSILRSIVWQKGDKILRFSTAYNMVIQTLDWLSSTAGIIQVVVPLKYPITGDKQLIDAVADALATAESSGDGKIKMCIFSHISSLPTMIEPVKELSAICKQHGATVLIDGAHAPGVLDIHVQEIGADFYTGNLHKWMFCPKGCAFLWTTKK